MTKDLASNASISNSESDNDGQSASDNLEELSYFEDSDLEEISDDESEPDIDNDIASEILDLTSREHQNKDLQEIYQLVKESQKTILSAIHTMDDPRIYDEIFEILKEHPTFVKIKFGGSTIDFLSADKLAELITTNDRIKYIDIEGCTSLGSDGLITIFRSLSENTTLEVLEIDRVGIDHVACEELIYQLKTNFTLVSLLNLMQGEQNEIYRDQDNISRDSNNKIRSFVTRNNELSKDQKKFYNTLKKDLVSELTKIYPTTIEHQEPNSLRAKEVMTFVIDKLLNQGTFDEIKKLFLVAKKPVFSSKDQVKGTGVSLGDDLSLKILSRAIKDLIKDKSFKISEPELETVGIVVFDVLTKKRDKILDRISPKPSSSQKLLSGPQQSH